MCFCGILKYLSRIRWTWNRHSYWYSGGAFCYFFLCPASTDPERFHPLLPWTTGLRPGVKTSHSGVNTASCSSVSGCLSPLQHATLFTSSFVSSADLAAVLPSRQYIYGWQVSLTEEVVKLRATISDTVTLETSVRLRFWAWFVTFSAAKSTLLPFLKGGHTTFCRTVI